MDAYRPPARHLSRQELTALYAETAQTHPDRTFRVLAQTRLETLRKSDVDSIPDAFNLQNEVAESS
jgi:hypothetical protein